MKTLVSYKMDVRSYIERFYMQQVFDKMKNLKHIKDYRLSKINEHQCFDAAILNNNGDKYLVEAKVLSTPSDYIFNQQVEATVLLQEDRFIKLKKYLSDYNYNNIYYLTFFSDNICAFFKLLSDNISNISITKIRAKDITVSTNTETIFKEVRIIPTSLSTLVQYRQINFTISSILKDLNYNLSQQQINAISKDLSIPI